VKLSWHLNIVKKHLDIISVAVAAYIKQSVAAGKRSGNNIINISYMAVMAKKYSNRSRNETENNKRHDVLDEDARIAPRITRGSKTRTRMVARRLTRNAKRAARIIAPAP